MGLNGPQTPFGLQMSKNPHWVLLKSQPWPVTRHWVNVPVSKSRTTLSFGQAGVPTVLWVTSGFCSLQAKGTENYLLPCSLLQAVNGLGCCGLPAVAKEHQVTASGVQLLPRWFPCLNRTTSQRPDSYRELVL